MADPIGRRGSAERRLAERRAIVEAHVALALGAVQERLESGWLTQEYSPLGRERHMSVVRRRMAAGHGDAAIDGRRYLLTIDAVVDEYFGVREPALDRALAALAAAPARNDNGGGNGNDGAGRRRW